jgi:hypothetical protein
MALDSHRLHLAFFYLQLTDKFKTVTARGDDENGGMRSRQAPGIRRGSFVRPGGR